MNKKILFSVIALALILLVSPMIGTVFAGKGQTKQSFEFIYQEHPISTDGPDAHASPREAIDFRTFHGRDTTHDSPILEYTITIADKLEERFTITGREGGCDYEFNSKTMMVIHRATETLTLSSGVTIQGTIVLSIIEKIDWSTMQSKGTFIGFGTGLFKDLKIVGTTSSEIIYWDEPNYNPNEMVLEITDLGTVMGWPGIT